ncbi:ABC transporter ATP-binding protein [Bradyrhizobium sp. LHD-71]|uniref:ABC transporter ATP-binding protein n=1 Tax=Bradyrhizobium sp. LHD-71 TaxID=3072141 RepID=UPI00280EC30A|nr:ABC transporter ATP-binding protein [Bradyrhizobium sp. LHD-71]MDQ8729136.1 ABC transporter ATP-binding protein [Bradyrhizobium sp. LHD-71]
MPAPQTTTAVIDVRDLRKWYPLRQGFLASLLNLNRRYLKAVDGVSFALREGEVLGLAGESGCGKSTTGMTVLQLHPASGGVVSFDGRDLVSVSGGAEMRTFRRKAQIVFQNPYESLNPRFTIEQSVAEPIVIHFPSNAVERRRRVVRALEMAGLVPAENFLQRYPHQLSGGQLQRVAIARAISVEPKFLVADEPVSMLDVSIRAGILNLLRHFATELRMAILYISHDLSTMRHICSDVAIMYLGRIVEKGPAADVLDNPQHPYAQALMAAAPVMGARKRDRVELKGALPNAMNVPQGCRFHPRCPQRMAVCETDDPALRPTTAGRIVACHLYQ